MSNNGRLKYFSFAICFLCLLCFIAICTSTGLNIYVQREPKAYSYKMFLFFLSTDFIIIPIFKMCAGYSLLALLNRFGTVVFSFQKSITILLCLICGVIFSYRLLYLLQFFLISNASIAYFYRMTLPYLEPLSLEFWVGIALFAVTHNKKNLPE